MQVEQLFLTLILVYSQIYVITLIVKHQTVYEEAFKYKDGLLHYTVFLFHDTFFVVSKFLHVGVNYVTYQTIPPNNSRYFLAALWHTLTETLGWCWRIFGYHRG